MRLLRLKLSCNIRELAFAATLGEGRVGWRETVTSTHFQGPAVFFLLPLPSWISVK